MLTVTENAKERFARILTIEAKGPDVAIRVKASSSELVGLDFVLDKEKEGDYVVQDSEGRKLLLVGPESIAAIKGAIITYNASGAIPGFIIERLGSDIS